MYSAGHDSIWSAPKLISGSTPAYSSVRPALVVDTLNRPFVCWMDEGSGNIYYVYCSDTIWTAPQPAFPKPGGNVGIRMALDKQNNIHAVWHEVSDTGGIWYSKWDWNNWSQPLELERDTNIVMAWADIAIDSKDDLHVIAMDYRNSKGYPLIYFKRENNIWKRMPMPPDMSTGQSCKPRLAIGRGDTLHLVWEERNIATIKNEGYYCNFYGNNWSVPLMLPSDTYDALEPQINYAVGTSHILWTIGSGTTVGILYWRRDSTGAWETPAYLTNVNSSSFPSIYYDQIGDIHSAWHANGDIFYSHQFVGIDTGNGFMPDTITWANRIICNKPNPFNVKTTVVYEIKYQGNLKLEIYNIIGQLKKTINVGSRTPGRHETIIPVDSSFANGIYLYRLKINNAPTAFHKMLIIK